MPNRATFLSLYVLFLLGMGWLAYKKPLNNWDAIAYSAIVLQYNQAGDAHLQVYQAARQQLSPADYNLLTAGSNQRKLWVANTREFNNLMPFYVVKPLYTRLAWLFYRCGLPLFKATVAPSVLAYILTGLLVFVWLGRYLSVGTTFALSLIIMLLPNVQEAVRLSTPDFIFAFFISLGMFFFIEKKQLAGFFISFIFAMLCRIDGIIPLLVLVTFYTYAQGDAITINLRNYMLLAGIAIAVFFTVSFSAITYGWDLLYFPSFFKTLTSGYSQSFSWHGYLELVKAQLFTALYYSHLLWFFLLGAMLFISKDNHQSADKKLLQALLIAIIIRFLLQPVISDRFYLAYCLLTIILVVRHLKHDTGKGILHNEIA